MFSTFPEDARWTAERQAVECGVEIGEYQGVVRIARVAEGPGRGNSLAERAPPRSPSGASRRGGVGPLRGAESRLRELR